jgi:hypothetical protein
MFRRLGALLAASTMLAVTTSASASALGDAAAQLQPGQWKVLNRAGDGSGFDYDLITSCQPSGCNDLLLNYADKGLWNPLTREIHFLGKGHLAELKHLNYGEATNKWLREAKPSWDCGRSDNCYSLGHGYEHTSLNPANGDIYARLLTSEVFKWNRLTKVWTALPGAPTLEVAIAIEYFPELGGLVMVGTRNNTGEVHLYRESTKTWSQLAGGLSMGPYHNVASYNPVHKVVIFGGGNGSSQLYRLDASGAVTPIANAPVGVGIMQSIFTVDPASGRQLLFSSGGGFYEYDVATNRWSTLSSSGVPLFASTENRIWMRVAVPISTHGVVAFLAEGGTSDTRVLLYRHAASTQAPSADTTPPPAPSGLTIK